MLASALDHYARQQKITERALKSARRARWGTLARLTAVVSLFQMAAARDAAESVPLMLAEQGIDADVLGIVVPAALAGVASDGRPLDSLLDLTRAGGVTDYQFDRIVATQVQDAARQAAGAAVATRPQVPGYVRMLNPPSCSRCAILAGREYRWNAGFLRHPGCDCRHVPAAEDTFDSLTTNPRAYFDSLPPAADLAEQHPDMSVAERRKAGLYSQEDIFTRAGARAIRDGADPGRVVNARRGMRTAQVNLRGWIPKGRMVREEVFGRQLATTTEMRTRHGVRTGGRGRPYVRLMPESIYEIADDRADAVRLLKRYGYIRTP